jgi:integrase/recombinase XerD
MRGDLTDYLSELRARNYSNSRLLHVQRAVWVLTLYLREAHQVSDWREVRLAHLQGFTVFASERYRTPNERLVGVNTLRQWLSCVRGFFAWMSLRERLDSNPAERLSLPKAPQTLPRLLNEKRMARLIEMPDVTTVIGVRDRALMETLYATGIRHGEAHRLNLCDVEFDSAVLMVQQGKGRRDRIIPLTGIAIEWLSRYITLARPQLALDNQGGRRWPASSTTALWLSKKGRRLSYQMIAERVSWYASKAKVEATVHTFRHSCATHLLKGGANTRYIQKLLGHNSIDTTEIYTKVEVKDLRRAMEKAIRRLERSDITMWP